MWYVDYVDSDFLIAKLQSKQIYFIKIFTSIHELHSQSEHEIICLIVPDSYLCMQILLIALK